MHKCYQCEREDCDCGASNLADCEGCGFCDDDDIFEDGDDSGYYPGDDYDDFDDDDDED